MLKAMPTPMGAMISAVAALLMTSERHMVMTIRSAISPQSGMLPL